MSYVLEVLLVTAFGFSLVTFVVGLMMFIAPDKIHALAARLDVSISTDEFFGKLDSTKYIDRYVYKYHYIFGLFIVVGAVYTIFMLAPIQGEYRTLPEIINPAISNWLYDALVLILFLFCSFVILIGFVLFFRPSAMKAFEAKMNTWKETSHLTTPLDKQRYLEQQKPLKYPKLYGFIVASGSLFILWQTSTVVFN